MNAPADVLSRAAQMVISTKMKMTKNQPASAPACRTPQIVTARCESPAMQAGHLRAYVVQAAVGVARPLA